MLLKRIIMFVSMSFQLRHTSHALSVRLSSRNIHFARCFVSSSTSLCFPCHNNPNDGSSKVSRFPFLRMMDIGHQQKKYLSNDTAVTNFNDSDSKTNNRASKIDKQRPPKAPSCPKTVATRKSDATLLIVGLGNPGDQYRMTRHNIGYLIAEELSKYFNVPLTIKQSYLGEVARVSRGDKTVFILRPTTFMNLSGNSVRRIIDRFQIPVNPSSLLVISDEKNLSFGEWRLKIKGSAGGHNGLKSIDSNLPNPRKEKGCGTKSVSATATAPQEGRAEYARLKVGIGGAGSNGTKNGRHHNNSTTLADYVLGEFSSSEKKELKAIVERAAGVIRDWIDEDNLHKVLTKCNSK